MEPRFTLSVHTVARSTEGAAGLSLETPMVTPTMRSRETAARIICFLRLAFALDGRGISIFSSYDARAVPVPAFNFPQNSLQRMTSFGFTVRHRYPAVRSWTLHP